jgi:dolichol-phosphate mannosyltransferase
MKRAIAIPAYNEAATIGDQVSDLIGRGLADFVVVANDSSCDETGSVASNAGAHVVDVPKARRGMAGVYRAGLEAALNLGAEFVMEMDAGGSHSIDEVQQFWDALITGQCEVAAGRRFGEGANHGAPWQRVLLSKVGTVLTNLRHGTEFQDATSGFIAYRAMALSRLLQCRQLSEGHYYQTEMRVNAHMMGYVVHELPIHYASSSSSLNWRSITEAVRCVFT